jgi:hypothetical protein
MIEVRDIAAEDAAYWANLNRIKLQGGQWSFDDRPYLQEPMQMPTLQRGGQAPLRMCAMKGTQLGWTELMVNIVLHGQIHGHYRRGVLYLFPSNNEVSEFSKSRFNPLIAANPTAIGKYVKDTDTANLKNINGSMLYLRGARASIHLEAGNKEAAQLRGLPVDMIVLDELDMMDFDDVIVKVEGRLGDSDVGTSAFISNPTLPDRGIATLYEKSDQRQWFRRCGCGVWTCPDEHFPDLVGKRPDGTGYMACKKCGKPTDARIGQWVPQFRDNSDYMWGYQLSQLGKPYVAAEDRLTTVQVLALCGDTPQLDAHKGPCAMGIDVKAHHKNVVIGIRSGRDHFTILRVARVSGGMEAWDDILRMGKRFNVKSCVVDIRPLEDAARSFQKRAKFKTWLCEYRESTPVGTQYHDKTGLVTVNRTEICDTTHRLVTDEKSLSLPAKCPELKQFAIECCNTAKCEVVDKKTKTVIYRYIKLGDKPDDYRHALNYFYLAASGGKVAVVRNDGQRNRRQTHARNEYARC